MNGNVNACGRKVRPQGQALGLPLLLLAGCVFDADLAPGARVTCRGPADCPPGIDCIDGLCASRDAPSALSGSIAAVEDTALDVALEGSSPIDAPLVFRVVDEPLGALTVDESGVGTYTPPPDFAGADAFTFVVETRRTRDGEDEELLVSVPATIVVDVAPVNDVPVVALAPLVLDEDTAQGIDLAITDVDGDDVAVTVITAPDNGTATLIGGVLLYDPNPDYFGADSLVIEAFDGEARVQGTISIDVTPVNDLAVVVEEAINAPEDEVTDVQLEAIDADGETVFTWEVVTHPTNGDAEFVSDNGTLRYSPRPNYEGPDEVVVAVTDASGTRGPLTALAITVVPVEDPPVAFGQARETDEDTELAIVLDGDSPDTTPLTFVIVQQPENGFLRLDDGFALNGLVAYRPRDNFNGQDFFTFQVINGSVASDEATVTLEINAVVDPPRAIEAEHDVEEDGSVEFTLRGEAPDAASFVFEIVTLPAHGELLPGTDDLDNSFIYVPDADYFGDDELTFVVRTNDGLTSEPATITFDVDPVFDPPLSFDDDVATEEDETLVIDLDGFSPDGEAVIFELVGPPPLLGTVEGAAGFDESGVVLYEPNENVFGTDSFQYRVRTLNGDVISDVATVTIDVRPVNDPPTVVTGSEPIQLTWLFATDEVAEISAFDVDGDTLDVEVDFQPGLGTASPVAGGGVLGVSYRPNINGQSHEVGRDLVRATVIDGNGGRTPVRIEVDIISARGCAAAKNTGADDDGLYTFANGPGFTNLYRAFCDMNDDGGGWTLLAAFTGDDPRFASGGPAWIDPVGAAPEPPSTASNAHYQALPQAPLTELRIETFDASVDGNPVGTVFLDLADVPPLVQRRSLRDLFISNTRITTSIGDSAWESLLTVGTVGTLCDEGTMTPTATLQPCVLCAVGTSGPSCPPTPGDQIEVGVGLSGIGAGVVDRAAGSTASPRVLLWGRDLDFTNDLPGIFDACFVVDDRFTMAGYYQLTTGVTFCNL